ncbi:MAG: ABC transporter permease [Acidobacteria bacterium]|nr:ABC transporter permease [Acidobacteriota bacterium]
MLGAAALRASTSTAETKVASQIHLTLPDKPLVSIRPSTSWSPLNLRDLWQYRDLLYFLVLRDVKVRYKQTALGVAWAVVQPLFTMLIFSFIFGRLAGIKSDGVPYPLFAYAGLLSWTFFANAVTSSGNSLVGSANLITKVYFPRLLVPVAAVIAGLVDFAIAFLLLAVLMLYYRVELTWQILMLPVLMSLTTLLAIGVGMWLSALNVKYRDIRHALPFLIQLWFFASPIIYPASIFEHWRWLLALNPMAGLIEGYRAALYGSPFDWPMVALSSGLTLTLLIYATFMFRRMEKSFADII